jgi:hypothetical protein
MNKNYRSIRLLSDDTAALDRKRGESGEVYYDKNSVTLRIYDAHTIGGVKLATQTYTGTAISAALATVPTTTTVNSLISTALIPYPTISSLTTTLSSYASLTNPSFNGTVTGTFSGNLTGNVIGNADTATKLAASRNINGVAFDGSANISVNTLVNNTSTVNLHSDGTTVFPNTGQIDFNGGYTRLKNTTHTGAQIGSPDDQNYVQTDNSGVTIQVNSDGLGNLVQSNWVFSTTGDLTAPGNISSSTGTVSANAVTTTNDVTVGGNANISTVPTLPNHATNKKYVDTRAIALSIAMS